MSSEAVFFVLLAAVAVNLVVMAALIVAPIADRRLAARGRAGEPTVDPASRDVPVPRYRMAEPPADDRGGTPPTHRITRVDFPVLRNSPTAGSKEGFIASGPPAIAEVAPMDAKRPVIEQNAVPVSDVPAAPAPTEPGQAEPDPAEPGSGERIAPAVSPGGNEGPLLAGPIAAEPTSAETIPSDPTSADPIAAEPVSAEQIPAEPPLVEPPPAEPVSAEQIPAEPPLVEPPSAVPGARAQARTSPPANGVVARTERAGRKFRIPAHDDPRTSRSIQSFLNRRDAAGDGPASPALPRPRTSRDGARGTPRGRDRTPAGIDAIWPVDPLTGLGNRVAWDALVATQDDWLAPGDAAAVVVLQVDVVTKDETPPGRPSFGPGGARRGEAQAAGGPDRRAATGSAGGRTVDRRPTAGAAGAAGPTAWMPALAGALRLELRSSDRLARLGPGLVAGLLAGTTGEQARVVVERLRAAVEQSLVARRAPLRLTTGVADVQVYGGIDAALDAALAAADLLDAAPDDAPDAQPGTSRHAPPGAPRDAQRGGGRRPGRGSPPPSFGPDVEQAEG